MIRRRIQASAPDIGALLLLILLPLMVFWRIWASNPDDRIIFGGDILMGAFPTRVFVHQLTSIGQLPLWNPYQLGGMPLAGDIQVAPFYLPNLILEWLSRGKDITYLGFELLVIAHYMLGAIGMYAYLRRMNIQVAAALVGAIAFEFNGFFIGHRGHYNMLATAAWLPAVLCLCDYAWFARGSVRIGAWSILAGFTFSQMVMAGHPQATLYCGTLFAAYGLWRWANDLRQHHQQLQEAKAAAAQQDTQELPQPARARLVSFLQQTKPIFRVPVVLTITGLIGLGISAVALIPAVELLGRSLRSAPTYEFAAQYSLLPRNLIGLFVPELLGWSGTEFRIYAGVITLVLAATALVVPTTGRKERSFFVVAAITALVVAMGGFTMLQGVIYRFLPGFTSVRVSARAFFIANLALAVLAAFGAETLFRTLADPEQKRLRGLVRVLGGMVGVAMLGGAILYLMLTQNYKPVGEDFFFSENLFSQTPAKDAFGLLTQVTNQYFIFLFLFVAALGILLARATNRLGRQGLMIAAILVTIIDIGTYAPYHDTLKADPEKARIAVRQYATTLLDTWWERQDQQQLIDRLSQVPDGVRIDNTAEILPDNYSQIWRSSFATGYNVLDIKERFALLSRWPNLSNTMKWDLLGVGYILTAPDAKDPPEADAKLLIANSQGKFWQRANQPAYAHFSTSIRPGNTSLTVNGLLSMPEQRLDTKPSVDAGDANLRAILAERWPTTIDASLYQIGTTGVRSPVDLGTMSGGAKYGAIVVDGKTVTPEQRGIVMAMVDPQTGKVIGANGYDTYQLAEESDRLAVAIEAAPQGTIIALATYDEGTAKLSDRTRAAFVSIGAGQDLRDAFGKAYNLIGVKGAAPGTALERLSDQPITLDVGIGAAVGQPISTFHTEMLRYEQDRITLLVQNNESGLLTISETYYPGWVAYVDGVATPIIRANGMQRAIVLPSAIDGKPHEVAFVYQPISFRLGSAISLATFAIGLGLLAALAVAALPRRVPVLQPVPQV